MSSLERYAKMLQELVHAVNIQQGEWCEMNIIRLNSETFIFAQCLMSVSMDNKDQKFDPETVTLPDIEN